MIVEQLTILTGNSAAHLSRLLSLLSGAGVDIRAHCLVDNGDGNCKLRMVVSDSARAVSVLQKERIAVVTNDVAMVETNDMPGALGRMLRPLESSAIQIEYSYTAASKSAGKAVMVFRFSDNAEAVRMLEKIE